MKTKLKILDWTLIVLVLFFGSAVLSNIISRFAYGISPLAHMYYFVVFDALNILFVIGLIMTRKGVANYIRNDRFDRVQFGYYNKGAWCLLLYSVLSSVRLLIQQLVFDKEFKEYGQRDFANYFIISLIGISLLIIAEFIRKAEIIQQENDLTL